MKKKNNKRRNLITEFGFCHFVRISSNRTQVVNIDGWFPDTVYITSGVPHGSVLHHTVSVVHMWQWWDFLLYRCASEIFCKHCETL